MKGPVINEARISRVWDDSGDTYQGEYEVKQDYGKLWKDLSEVSC